MKKVAVLYYGLHQGFCFNECFLNFQKAVIEPNKHEYNFDIFIHRWIEDKNTKNWLPWYNSVKINKSSINIDREFLNSVVKPKVLECEPFIDFSKKEYHEILGADDFIYKYNQLYSKKLNKYIVYNDASRYYSVKKVNDIRKKYETENNIKYDNIIILNSQAYLFEKFMLDKLDMSFFNVWGFYPFDKKIPKYLKCKESGYIRIKSLNHIIIVSNNDLINKYCSCFDNLHKYYKKELPKCKYYNFNYLQPGYMKYLHLTEMNIPFKNIELLGGRYTFDGVKITFNLCPLDKFNLINSCTRKDGIVLSKDARDYIKCEF